MRCFAMTRFTSQIWVEFIFEKMKFTQSSDNKMIYMSKLFQDDHYTFIDWL